MSARLRQVLFYAISFAVAAGLLYLALRGVDFSEIGQALQQADYRWLLPLTVVIFLSHWLRAWRWKLLLDTDSTAEEAASVKTAFYSLMIGYMVNYAAPRAGEFARAANQAVQEKRSFSNVFGTVVAERLIDMLSLLVGMVLAFFLLLGRLGEVYEQFFAPAVEALGGRAGLWLTAGGLLLVGLLALGLWYWRAFPQGWLRQKLQPFWQAFREGLLSLRRTGRAGTLVGITVAMWGCYVLMAYLPFVILGSAQVYHLSLADAWVIMIMGSFAIVIPAPGGVGTYHFITVQTLTLLYAVPNAPAATYAVLAHAAQLILYVAAGALSLLLQGSSLHHLRRDADTAQAAPDPSHA